MDAAPFTKIADPGVYDIPIECYHSQCTVGPSISSTGIRRILESPAKYWMYSDLNPKRLEEKKSDALILGGAAHHLLLGQDDFKKHYIVRPEELYGDKWNGNRKDCKAWVKEHEEEGFTVLTPSDIETIKGLAGLQEWQKSMPNCGLRNTELVMKGALTGEIEKSIIWPAGKIWLKARPDAIPAASNDVADLKTTTSVETHDLARTIYERGYYIQGALVGMGMSAVMGRQMEGFHLIFVDKEQPHDVAVRTLTDDDLVRGERAIFAALAIFQKCLTNGSWPGATYDDAPASRISLPDWAREQFDRRLDHLEREYQL